MALSNVISKFCNNKTKVSVYSFNTPIGKVYGAADDDFLYIVTVEDSKKFEKSFSTLCEKLSCNLQEIKNNILEQLEKELESYFKGKLKQFTVPIKCFGSTFQQSVWDKLQDLPYASTQTYGDLAKALGRPLSHSRAIGAACGANSHLIVIPCHRIVATNSKGGFSSGIDRKEWLIEHEKKYSGKPTEEFSTSTLIALSPKMKK